MKKLLLLISLLSWGCSPSYVPFTQAIREDLEQKGQDFSKVQFGIKDKIILNRAFVSENQQVVQGQIKKQSEVVRNQIVFTKGVNEVLAGICKEHKPEALAMYFEEGNDNEKRLVFSLSEKGNYVFYVYTKQIKYDGQTYSISQGHLANLYINRVELKTLKETSRKVSGLKVK